MGGVNIMKKILSLLICISMVLGMFPAITFADGEEPTWLNDIGALVTPGTLIGDYTFKNTNVPGEFIPTTLNESEHYSATYTDAGFVMTKLTEPVQDDRATTISQGGKINLVANLLDNENASMYQYGFTGKYIIDLYVSSNLTMNLTGNQTRFDWTIGSNEDINSAGNCTGKYTSVRVTSGSNANGFALYGSGSSSSNATHYLTKGETYIVRLAVDTGNNISTYLYDETENKFVYAGSGNYTGSLIQSIYFTPRLGFAKDSTFTFKGVKIYEVAKNTSAEANIAVDSVKNEALVTDPKNVTENISIPQTWIDNGYEIKSSDPTVLGTNGAVTGSTEDKNVSLTVSGKKDGICFSKTYNFVVKAGANQGGSSGGEEEDNTPDWLKDIVPNITNEKLISNYNFANSDKPWEKVPNNFPTDSTDASKEFVGEYTSEGFKITKLQDGTSSNNGTSTKYYGRINFVKVTDAATASYESGFRGQYVIDLTFKADMNKTAENTEKTTRFDMYLGYNEDITAYSNTTKFNAFRFGSDNLLKLYDNTNSGSTYAYSSCARGEDCTRRLIIDTDEKQIALYSFDGTEYSYEGSCEYFGDSVQGLYFNPRLGFSKDSYFEFKNVKIYEIKKTAEPLIVVDGTVPGPGEGGSGDDPDDNIPDWAETLGYEKIPGTLVSDYSFKNSNVPGEFIPNDFADTPHFSAEYTDEGFVLTKLTEPTTEEERGTAIDQKGKLNFVVGLGKDDVNKTGTYQFGLVGTYVVDLYVNSNLSMNLSGNAARFDWTFTAGTDISTITASGSYATVRVTSGGSNNPFQIYGPSSVKYFATGVNYNMPKGEDTIVRLVINTKEGEMAYFTLHNNEFVFAGSGPYGGDILQSVRFSPRLGFAAGSTFTFKGVKIYEIERYVNEANGMADRNFQVTETIKDTSIFPEFIVGNPNAVTDSFTLSGTDWTTSNEKMVTTAGNVFRGYDDEIVTLRKQFVTNVTPALVVFKDYDLNVLKRPDVVNEAIGTHDFKTEVEGVVYADKANTEVTSEGLVIKNPGNSIIVPVKRYVASDSTSSTYVNNLKGVFDYEFDITPSVAKKYDEGGKPVTIESGYYDAATGSFTSYASFNIYNGIAYYKTNATGFTAVKVANDASNIIKIRTDSVKNKIWIYVNGVRSNELEYMGNGYVNAYRVSVNEGAEASDKITVKSTNITSLFEFENRNFSDSAINACVNKVAELVMSKVTSKPEDAYGPMGDLPETLGDYKVEWTVDSDYVDLAEKYAYAYEQKQNVVVTAKVYDSGNSNVFVTKEFYIVIKETNDPVILLESTTSKLAARFITNQNAGNIITDIVLPETLEGNTVVWTSSDDTLISLKGVVNKNEKDISEPTAVTLTAVVSNGTTEVTKKVNFTVAKQGKDITLYTNSASIETPITGVVTYEADLNGAATLKDSNGKKIIELNETGAIKVVMDFNNSKVSVFKDGVLITDYVDFAEAAENFKAVESSNVTNEKIILDEYELYNYNVEKFNLLDELRKGFITGNITLGETTIGGAVVTWDSENTAILDNSGNFIAPENVMFFDVNFSITLPGGTGATYTEKLNMVAVPKNNIFAGGTYVNQGTSVPAAQYYTSLMFDGNYSDTMFRGAYANSTKSIVIDMQNVQDINTLYISNDGIKSLDVYVSDDNVDWKLVAQPVFDGSKEKNLVVFETENTRYVKISNISYDGAYVDIYEIGGFTVYDSSDKSYLDILAIALPEDYVLNVSSLTLPSTGAYGSTFVWTSSNPQIISTTGVVSKPVYDTEVLLTVTSTNGTASSTKTYRYLVKGAQGGQGGIPSGGGSGGGAGAGGTFMGDTSTSAFPEVNVEQVPVDTNGKIFDDVDNTAWYYKYVLDLKANNIVNGDDKNRFNPNKNVTREEFVKMIIVAAGYELVTDGKGFRDVKSSDWFSTYVYTAKANGIINGITENQFGVNRAISRQDMSVIIKNIISVDVDISTNRDKFTDDTNISTYAYDAVYTMKALGIINGYETGDFNPNGQLTRAEAAKVISMVMDIIK